MIYRHCFSVFVIAFSEKRNNTRIMLDTVFRRTGAGPTFCKILTVYALVYMPYHYSACTARGKILFKSLFEPYLYKIILIWIRCIYTQNFIFSRKRRIKRIFSVGYNLFLRPSDINSLVWIKICGSCATAGMVSVALKRKSVRLRPCCVRMSASVVKILCAKVVSKLVRGNAYRHYRAGLVVFTEIADTTATGSGYDKYTVDRKRCGLRCAVNSEI